MVRIAHANYRIRDVEPTLAFWAALGLSCTGCLQISEGYYLIYLSAPGNDDVTIELTVQENPPEGYDRSPGAGHIALAVGDLDAAVGRLREQGIPVTVEPFHPVTGNDLRVAFTADPNGMKVELIEGDFPTPRDPMPA
ncbi:VOC family protein [Sphingobium sp. DC-2]|uniref:VOC family protein n=1 Tax=Sphingobium sp. DC-2 TaxID=1303256 RepID=UPI0004C42280|nr:VOC family protein [Sphingobium sp. DC-2]